VVSSFPLFLPLALAYITVSNWHSGVLSLFSRNPNQRYAVSGRDNPWSILAVRTVSFTSPRPSHNLRPSSSGNPTLLKQSQRIDCAIEVPPGLHIFTTIDQGRPMFLVQSNIIPLLPSNCSLQCCSLPSNVHDYLMVDHQDRSRFEVKVPRHLLQTKECYRSCVKTTLCDDLVVG
jgi:hypothetical protein